MSDEGVKPPLIWADFNNWRTTQLLALGLGSIRELGDLVEPREGMPLRVYDQDSNEDDLADYLIAEGVLVPNHGSWALESKGFSHVSDTPPDHWSRHLDWDAEDRSRRLGEHKPGRSGIWSQPGAGSPSLDAGIARIAELMAIWAQARNCQLPAWTGIVLTEEVNGQRSEVWHDREDFQPRYAQIRKASRDWISLHAIDVVNGRLRLAVEYRTDRAKISDMARYLNLIGPEESWWRSICPEQPGDTPA
jgi:hypothetical protein